MNLYHFSVIFFSLFLMTIGTALLVRPVNFRHTVSGFILLFIGYFQVNQFLFESGLYVKYIHLMFTSYPTTFALGPLIFLFAKSIADKKSNINPKDLFHFLLPLAVLIILIPFYIKSGDEKIYLISLMIKGKSPLLLLTELLYLNGVIYLTLSMILILRRVKPEKPVHKKAYVFVFILLVWIAIAILQAVTIATQKFVVFRISNILFAIHAPLIFLLFQRSKFLLYGTLSDTFQKSKSYLGMSILKV